MAAPGIIPHHQAKLIGWRRSGHHFHGFPFQDDPQPHGAASDAAGPLRGKRPPPGW